MYTAHVEKSTMNKCNLQTKTKDKEKKQPGLWTVFQPRHQSDVNSCLEEEAGCLVAHFP